LINPGSRPGFEMTGYEIIQALIKPVLNNPGFEMTNFDLSDFDYIQ